VLSEEERKDVERRHGTSPLLHVRRALLSSAIRDLSLQFNGFRVVSFITSTALINTDCLNIELSLSLLERISI
jgi:hypothetical protein